MTVLETPSFTYVDSSCSRTLLCTFGGIADAVGIPQFEFFNVTQPIKVQKLYVRDLYQAWYQKGIPDIPRGLYGAIQALRKIFYNCDRVVTCGNSMGGFAAMLFGGRAGVRKVLAFSPQVCITKGWREANGETRWTKFMNRVDKAQGGCRDVRGAVKQAVLTDFSVWYSSNFELDRKHAALLRGYKNVTLYPIKATGHNIVRHLRDTGELVKIIEGACFD